MARDFLGSAEFSLRQQVEIFGRDGVSLTSLWRAVGRPRGHDPRAWTLLAQPLIAGYARYLADLDPDADRPVVWVWNGDDGEPWRVRRPHEPRRPRPGLRRLPRRDRRRSDRPRPRPGLRRSC